MKALRPIHVILSKVGKRQGCCLLVARVVSSWSMRATASLHGRAWCGLCLLGSRRSHSLTHIISLRAQSLLLVLLIAWWTVYILYEARWSVRPYINYPRNSKGWAYILPSAGSLRPSGLFHLPRQAITPALLANVGYDLAQVLYASVMCAGLFVPCRLVPLSVCELIPLAGGGEYRLAKLKVP